MPVVWTSALESASTRPGAAGALVSTLTIVVIDDGVADVVGAGEDVAVAAGGEAALGRGADEGGGGAVGGAGVGVERALLTGQRGGAKTRDRIGVVGAETDGEGAVVVVALRAAGARRDGVDRQRAAGGCGGVGGEGEVGGGRA